MPPKKIKKLSIYEVKKRAILLSSFGAFLVLISTVNFIYVIPNIDNTIFHLDGQITDAENLVNQFQLIETKGYIPYVISKSLPLINKDLNRDSLKFFIEEVINLHRQSLILLESVILLGEQQKVTQKKMDEWKKLNFNELENLKVQKSITMTKRLNSIIAERKGNIEKKQDILFWTTIIQILGLLLTQIAIIYLFIKTEKIS